MNYRGRQLDPVAFWERYVEFPSNMDESGPFLPLVTCPNPYHDTMKRHYQINVEQPTVHCFAQCGISGSYEHAICVIENLYSEMKVGEAKDKHERRRRIAKARRKAKKIILGDAALYGQKVLKRNYKPIHQRKAQKKKKLDLSYDSFIPQAGLEYLESRGIDADSVARWELGWDRRDLRIVIPAQDLNGTTRFLIKRAIREKVQPKYLYTEGFPKTSLLFGACNIDLGLLRSDGLILTEGATNPIRLHQHGLRTATAILGTGISVQQVRIVHRLNPSRIYLMFDKDTAGVRNIEIAAKHLRSFPLFVCRYPRHREDPAEFTKEEAHKSVETAIPYLKFKQQYQSTRTTERSFAHG